MIQYIQVETTLAPIIGSLYSANQFILAVRKNAETNIRAAYDTVKVRRLHISFEHHLSLSRKAAVCRIGKISNPGTLTELLAERTHRLADMLQGTLVLGKTGRNFVLRMRNPCGQTAGTAGYGSGWPA